MMKVYVNGVRYDARTVRELQAELLLSFPNIDCWSYDALRKLFLGIVEMIVELGYQVQRKEPMRGFMRFASQLRAVKLYFPKTREETLQKIYDVILSVEGMALMRRLGIVDREGDKIIGNPEKVSVVDVEPLDDDSALPLKTRRKEVEKLKENKNF